MTNAQETRPTARQIVLADAEKFGWTHSVQGNIDRFIRDRVAVHIGWGEMGCSTGSNRWVGGICANSDGSALCIVHAREWLAQERNQAK